MCTKGRKREILFITDEQGGKFWQVDFCIVRLVQMLLELKIPITQACCGHIRSQPIRISFVSKILSIMSPFINQQTSIYPEDLMSVDIVNKLLKPDHMVIINGIVTAEWAYADGRLGKLPYFGMYQSNGVGTYHHDGSWKARIINGVFHSWKVRWMYINEGLSGPCWWRDMPDEAYFIVQMLRQMGVRTSYLPATSLGKGLLISGEESVEIARKISGFSIKEFKPGWALISWDRSPIIALREAQDDIPPLCGGNTLNV